MTKAEEIADLKERIATLEEQRKTDLAAMDQGIAAVTIAGERLDLFAGALDATIHIHEYLIKEIRAGRIFTGSKVKLAWVHAKHGGMIRPPMPGFDYDNATVEEMLEIHIVTLRGLLGRKSS